MNKEGGPDSANVANFVVIVCWYKTNNFNSFSHTYHAKQKRQYRRSIKEHFTYYATHRMASMVSTKNVAKYNSLTI